MVAAKPAILPNSAAGVYLPEGRHPIIPSFQHSIIPINCERSEPKFLFISDLSSHSPNMPEPKRTKLVREIPNPKSQIPNNGVSFGQI